MKLNQLERAAQAVRDFVQGAASGDVDRMAASFAALDYGDCDGGGWARAMRSIARIKVPRATQEFFLLVHVRYGDHIRQECDDLVLADGLRVLLPKYKGPAMRLYRGDSFRNRSRRTYGLSWSACADVARGYAETGFYRVFDGGSVLLETLALPEAIIAAVALSDDRYGEKEYIVDRRRLTSVKAIGRFPQLSLDEFDEFRDEFARRIKAAQ